MVARLHSCTRCGRTDIRAKLEAVVVAHRCIEKRPRSRWTIPEYDRVSREEILADDRRRWAETQLGGAVADALPEEQKLRPE